MANEAIAPNKRVSNSDLERQIVACRQAIDNFERRLADQRRAFEKRIAKLEAAHPEPDAFERERAAQAAALASLPAQIRATGPYIRPLPGGGYKVFDAVNWRVGSIVGGEFTTEIVE